MLDHRSDHEEAFPYTSIYQSTEENVGEQQGWAVVILKDHVFC
jgi:hypothetical protein